MDGGPIDELVAGPPLPDHPAARLRLVVDLVGRENIGKARAYPAGLRDYERSLCHALLAENSTPLHLYDMAADLYIPITKAGLGLPIPQLAIEEDPRLAANLGQVI